MTFESRVLTSPAYALLATFACAVFAGCATEQLTASPPAGVDLSGEWKLDPDLSDDPQRLLEEKREQSRPPSDDHSGPSERGGPGGGLPPFGRPGGRSGGWNPGGGENLVSDGGRNAHLTENIGSAADETSGGSVSGAGENGPENSGPDGARVHGDDGFAHLLDVPEHMTITQNGSKLIIKTDGPGGQTKVEEFTAGEKSTISFGHGDADCTAGWRGEAFVISMKPQKGPGKEDAFALDSEGHLIVTTQLIGGRMSKVDIKHVYNRVRAQRN